LEGPIWESAAPLSSLTEMLADVVQEGDYWKLERTLQAAAAYALPVSDDGGARLIDVEAFLRAVSDLAREDPPEPAFAWLRDTFLFVAPAPVSDSHRDPGSLDAALPHKLSGSMSAALAVDSPLAFPALVDRVIDVSWKERGFARTGFKDADDADRQALADAASLARDRTTSAYLQTVTDRPATTEDQLGRGVLAFGMAHLINRLWSDANPTATRPEHTAPSKEADAADVDAPASIVHIDAPWGGGKTTFANFLARILNPAAFRLNPSKKEGLFKDLPMSSAEDERPFWPKEYADRKWVIVDFNAWANQHVSPPWWNLYETIWAKRLGVTAPFARLGARIREWGWRTVTPATQRMLAQFAIVAAAVAILWSTGLLEFLFGAQTTPTDTPEASDGVKLAIAALAGGAGVVALFEGLRNFVRVLVETGSSSYDTAVLGKSDPVGAFRAHFRRSMARFGRPVLVVVDDLDRCKPDYVVDLLRGMLTIFRSPMLVFVILGDRRWIETAFEIVHDPMQPAHAEASIGFGERFVEKTVQLSFLLPKPSPVDSKRFVTDLLGGRPTKRENQHVAEAQGAALRALAPAQGDMARRSAAESASAAAQELAGGSGAAAEAVQRAVQRAVTLRIASEPRALEAITHKIAPLAPEFPSNPRRAKRIVNMVAAYQVSLHAMYGEDPSSEAWRKMVLWTLLMSEHPKAWRALCARPALADEVEQSPADDDRALALIRTPGVRQILTGSVFGEAARLDSKAVAWLADLTPAVWRHPDPDAAAATEASA
jgi:hypothetical protein